MRAHQLPRSRIPEPPASSSYIGQSLLPPQAVTAIAGVTGNEKFLGLSVKQWLIAVGVVAVVAIGATVLYLMVIKPRMLEGVAETKKLKKEKKAAKKAAKAAAAAVAAVPQTRRRVALLPQPPEDSDYTEGEDEPVQPGPVAEDDEEPVQPGPVAEDEAEQEDEWSSEEEGTVVAVIEEVVDAPSGDGLDSDEQSASDALSQALLAVAHINEL